MTNVRRFLQFVPWLLATVVLIIGLSLLYAPIQAPTVSTRSTTRVQSAATSAEEAHQTAQRIESLWSQMLALQGDDATRMHFPKATEEQICELEDQIGVRLPADYRAFLKLHNGSLWHSGCLYPTPDNVNEILWTGYHNEGYGDFGEPFVLDLPEDGGQYDAASNNWHPALITIIEDDGAGFLLRIDTGEVLFWDHDGWSFQYIATNFEELLKKSVEKSIANGNPDWWMN